ncbi:MAG: tetratricopeptide repeat protein [Nannocystaceae bacterium]|nr:tetratricopeptide repeat protein [Nannocystaceae bacterium]
MVAAIDHVDIATTRNNIGTVLFFEERYAEAAEEFTAAADIFLASNPEHPQAVVCHVNVAMALEYQKRFDEAETMYRASLVEAEGILQPEHPTFSLALFNLGAMLSDLGRGEEALPLVERAWLARKQPGVAPEARAVAAYLLAETLWKHRPEQRTRARRLGEEARDAFEKAGPAHRLHRETVHAWLAETAQE